MVISIEFVLSWNIWGEERCEVRRGEERRRGDQNQKREGKE
jgi:hypothetical protein